MLRHDPEDDGNVITSNLFCASGCFIPDGKWREYVAVCDIHKIVQDSPLVEKLGIVSGVTVGIHGVNKDLNWYFDNFQESDRKFQ